MASLLDRRKDAAYGYLCHLEEARKWVESIIQETLPDAQQWEHSLCNGICLCKLGAKLLPDFPIWKKIYDLDQTRFKTKGLEYRHTDNINFFLLALKKIGLPKIFYPSTVDIFESKNIPQLIYCIHALSHFLKVKGSVRVTISDLYGKASFPEEAVTKISIQLENNQKDLPAFDVVENLVEEELQYESMGLTVESSDDTTTNVGNGKADSERDTTPPAAAPTLSSPSVPVVVNGDQTKPSDTKKIDLSSLFDDPSYAELQSMIEDMEKLGESFNIHSPSSASLELSTAEAPPTSPKTSTTSIEIIPSPEAATSLEASTPATSDNQETTSPVVEYTCKDSDVKAAVYSTVNKLKKRSSTASTAIPSDALFEEIDEAVKNSDPVETVKALKTASTKDQMAYVFTDIKYANLYHEALKREKQFSMPSSAVVIFRGINRDKCERMLEKMSPGAYILRACHDSNTEFVFSYRNQTGIKHWKITPTNKKYTWGNSPAFDSIEQFVENFARCLSTATKLHVYPGMTMNLHPEQSEMDEVREKLDEDDDNLDRPLTRDQINRVIVEVNSTINSLKRAEMSSEVSDMPPPLTLAPKPFSNKPWTKQSIRKVSRTDAESLLEKHGSPGTFLVRPSETEPGGFAIVFRTKTEMKRWKIVYQDGQYMVYPRPQKYPTLEKVVEVFIKGIKDHSGLDMVPLELPEDQVTPPLMSPVVQQPSPFPPPVVRQPKQQSPTVQSTSSSSSQDMTTSPRLSPDSTLSLYSRLNFSQAKKQDYIPDPPINDRHQVPARDEGGPSRSLSKLNPFNVTSWTVDDVTQWLVSEGLGQFTEEFGENLVDGECLINLDMGQLRDDLNVKALGHRHRLMKKINKLKEDCGLPIS